MKDNCVQFKKEPFTSSSDASSDDDDDLQQTVYEMSASSELSSSLKSQLPVSEDGSTSYSRSKMVLRDHSYQMDCVLNPQQQQNYNAFINSEQNGIDLSSHEAQEEVSMEEFVGDDIANDYCMVMTTTKHL